MERCPQACVGKAAPRPVLLLGAEEPLAGEACGGTDVSYLAACLPEELSNPSFHPELLSSHREVTRSLRSRMVYYATQTGSSGRGLNQGKNQPFLVLTLFQKPGILK